MVKPSSAVNVELSSSSYGVRIRLRGREFREGIENFGAMEVAMAAAVVTPSSFASSRPLVLASGNGLRRSFLETEEFLALATVRNSKQRSFASSSFEGSLAVAEAGGATRFEHAQETSTSMDRRELMGKAATLLMSSLAVPEIAAAADGIEEGYMLYQDEADKYSILVPQQWAKGEGTTSQRKVTAFYPESDISANVNIVITGLGADYTGLGSFGTHEMFAENLVNSLDRAWQKPPGQKARLIDDRSRNGLYYVEYTLQKPGEAQRHLLSVVGIASNGWINRLYTVTAQYWEDDSDKYKTRLQKIVSSFKLI